MASAVYSESPASRLSISLESPATASPFPSPSSSFLTPPTPGAHEFAVKPVPARAGRKGSVPSLSNTSASQSNTTITSSRSASASPRTSAAITSVTNGHSEGLVTEQPTKVPSLRSSLSSTQLVSSPSSLSQMAGGGSITAEISAVPNTTAASHPQELVVPITGLSPLPSPRSDTLISPSTPTPASVQRQPDVQPSRTASLRGRSLEPPRSPGPFISTSSTPTPTIPTTRLPQDHGAKSGDDKGSSTPQTHSARSSTNKDLADSLSSLLSPTSSSNPASSTAAAAASPQIVASSGVPRPRPSLSTRRSSRPLSTASISSTSSVGSSTSASGSGTVLAFDPALISSRPAPPSPGPLSAISPSGGGARPALSRSVSAASRSSMRERTGDRSRPPSTAVSRANSIKSKRASASSFTSGGGNPHPYPMPCSASLDPNETNTLSRRVGDGTLGVGSVSEVNTPTDNANNNQLLQNRVSVGSQLNPSFKLPSDTQKDMGSAVSAVLGGGGGGAEGSQTSIAAGSSSRTSIDPQPSVESLSSTTTTTTTDPQPPAPTQPRVYIKIRDYGYEASDERYNGLGQHVPKPNRVGRMNRKLEAALKGGSGSSRRTNSTASFGSEFSVSSSDGDGLEEDDDDDIDGWGWGGGGFGGGGYGGKGYGGSWGGAGGGGGFKMGMGRFSWASGGAATAATIFDQEKAYAAAAANLAASSSSKSGYPSQTDMDRNFLDSSEGSSEDFYDAEDDDDAYYDDEDGEGDGEEDTLYPGLYRAMYAFEPEGTAEMRLEEDQIVRVIGRGGGVGWAVVIAGYEHGAESAAGESDLAPSVMKASKHALVPESYLEPYKLDWELEELVGGTSTPSEE